MKLEQWQQFEQKRELKCVGVELCICFSSQALMMVLWKYFRFGERRRNPALGGRTRRSPPCGTGRGGAHALGSDEVETSSSESDEAWPGPWGLDEAETLSSEPDEVVVASLTIG